MNRRNELSDEKQHGGRAECTAHTRWADDDQRTAAGDQHEPQYDISDEDYAPIHFGAGDEFGRARYDDGGIPDDQREHRRFAELHNQHMRFGDDSERSGRYVPDSFAAHGYGRGTSYPGMERYTSERASPPSRRDSQHEPRFDPGVRYSRSYGAGSENVRYRNESELNYRYPRDQDASLHTHDYGEGDDYFVGRARSDGAAHASLYGSPRRDSDDHLHGGFKGLGPKNYTRSDERIREDISEKLADDPSIDASDISVDVLNGKVTLTGQVVDRNIKFRVEDLVDRCNGVQDIDNRLTLVGSSFTLRRAP